MHCWRRYLLPALCPREEDRFIPFWSLNPGKNNSIVLNPGEGMLTERLVPRKVATLKGKKGEYILFISIQNQIQVTCHDLFPRRAQRDVFSSARSTPRLVLFGTFNVIKKMKSILKKIKK